MGATLGNKRRVTQKEDFLSKAKEAEEMAKKAQTSLARETWRKIAENYRVLASAKETR